MASACNATDAHTSAPAPHLGGSGRLGMTHGSPYFAVFALTGSVIENPHGVHSNRFKFSQKARLIICSKIIDRPQTGQMTSSV